MHTPLLANQINELRSQLAVAGKLRVALNMSNFLLVNATDDTGQAAGVSPSIARLIASELGVEAELIPYAGPGQVADAADKNEWDIANIAAEAERARLIEFSSPYCEIQASYLLPPGSSLSSLDDVDQPGRRIVVKARSAYDLWLSENLKHAELIRTDSHDAAFAAFLNEPVDALAGLRPKLIEHHAEMPGFTILKESFTSVKQAIGCQPGKPEAAAFIESMVQRMRNDGTVARLIHQYGVDGKLSVPTQ